MDKKFIKFLIVSILVFATLGKTIMESNNPFIDINIEMHDDIEDKNSKIEFEDIEDDKLVSQFRFNFKDAILQNKYTDLNINLLNLYTKICKPPPEC